MTSTSPLHLLFVAAALGLGCDREPSIARVGSSMPPRFRIQGSAKTFGVLFSTPGEPIQGSPRFDVLWHLRPARNDTTASDAPEITYGVVPPGYRALRFDPSSSTPQTQTEPPPALQPGRVYIATLSTSTPNLVSTSYRDAQVCFEVVGAAVRDAPCPPRR